MVGKMYLFAMQIPTNIMPCGNNYGFRKERCLKDIFFNRKIVIFRYNSIIKIYGIIDYGK